MRLIRRLQAYLEYLVHTAGVASGELRTQLGIKSLRALLVARVEERDGLHAGRAGRDVFMGKLLRDRKKSRSLFEIKKKKRTIQSY